MDARALQAGARTESDKRHHFKVFKPVAEVVEDDLPPSFMKNALAENEVFGCPCC